MPKTTCKFITSLAWSPVKSQEDFKALPYTQQLLRIRHSASHIMASALLQLFPETSLAIGPATAQGFFYDVKPKNPLREEDLDALQQAINKIAGASQPFEVATVSKEQAMAYFQEQGQTHKCQILSGIASDAVTLYRHKLGQKPDDGYFIDLCAGPHVPHTGLCKATRVLGLSGVHWKGEEVPTLTRISGTAWTTEKDLKEYQNFLEDVKARDHRTLGPQLDLFSFHPWAAAALWHPHGVTLRHTLMQFWRETISQQQYVEILNPLLYKKELFECSGHWDHFQENMFIFRDEQGEADFALKPMNCPDTMLFFRSQKRSYRELPLRVAEGQILHRNEASGALHGLMRTRNFIQDDAHLFVTAAQVQQEVLNLLAMVDATYAMFELNYDIHLSTRPESFMGEVSVWDEAEAGLKAALEAGGRQYTLDEGEGAFYGPKIDIYIKDSLGRQWQCGTVQLDFQLPERFELEYVQEDGTMARPIVIHRAIFGSFERFMGILIEHLGGAFPTWLSPVQVAVLPIAERHGAYAKQVLDTLKAAGFRAILADQDSVNYRVRQQELRKTPYMLVVGDKEAEANTVSVRTYQNGPQGVKPLSELLETLQQLVAERRFDVTVKHYNDLFRGDAEVSTETEAY